MSERPPRRSLCRPGRRAGRLVQLLLVSVLVAVSVGLVILRPDLIRDLQGALLQDTTASLAVLGGLLVLFSLSQMIILPSGTALLLASGAVLGRVSGVVYSLAMVATAPIVYFTARAHPREARRLAIRGLPSGRWRKRLVSVLRAMQDHPVLGTAVLRLLPVIPSAVACLGAGAFGVPLRGFLLGSVLTGPIRPMAIATLGYIAGAAVIRSDNMTIELLVGLRAVSVASLGASIALLNILSWRAGILR